MKSIYLAALIMLLVATQSTRADKITTEMLMQASLDCVDCMDWKPVGVCIWMTCYLYNCEFDYSIRFKNYVPDFAVTSYSHKNTPFEEMQSVVNSMRELSFPAGSSVVPGKHVNHLRFKKTEVWGNPGTEIFREISDSSEGWICSSEITPYQPYYIWFADYMGWHMNIPDMFAAESWNGSRVMGTNAVRFGSVYPRCGWSIHPEDPKAAALAAQRAGYIVTNPDDSSRVRTEPETECGGEDACWAPGAIMENDMSTHKWQMLVPDYQTKGEIFGTKSGWSNRKYDTEEQYAWLLWRPYSCCTREGAVLIFTIDLDEGATEFNEDDMNDALDSGEFGDFGSEPEMDPGGMP